MSSGLGMVLAASMRETLLGDQPRSLAALAPVILRRSRRRRSSCPSLSFRTVGLPCVGATVDSPSRDGGVAGRDGLEPSLLGRSPNFTLQLARVLPVGLARRLSWRDGKKQAKLQRGKGAA